MVCVTGVASRQEILTPLASDLNFLRVHTCHGMYLFTDFDFVTDFVFVPWICDLWLLDIRLCSFPDNSTKIIWGNLLNLIHQGSILFS